MDTTTATSSRRSVARTRLHLLALILGPTLALVSYVTLGWIGAESAVSEPGRRAAAVMVWMAIWWLTEAVPLPVTSLLPLILLPLLEIMPPRDAAFPYANRVIFLFLGGFMMALAMERCNLHKRIALVTIALVGSSPRMIVAGFMIATAILSMWMSNTATTIMLVPIGANVIALVEERSRDGPRRSNFGICLMLAIAYSASLGGIATPIGTPPNTLLLAFLADQYGLSISFFRWMLFALPIVIVFLPIIWILLTRVLYPVEHRAIEGGRALIREELRKLGPTSRAEWTVMAVFSSAVIGWLVRGLLAPLDPQQVAPWLGSIVELLSTSIDDASIAVFAAILLFVIPTNLRAREFPLDWRDTSRLPWGILLLFGGGLSLAEAVSSSGLSEAIGGSLGGLADVSTILIILAVIATVVYLTEVTSNTATANIFFPLLAPIAVTSLHMDPLGLLVPAALAASCAFMMPVATPPNAIVFASGSITIRQMFKAGFWINMLAVAIILISMYTIIRYVLGIELDAVPEWALGAATR